jgi:hypothetical protein
MYPLNMVSLQIVSSVQGIVMRESNITILSTRLKTLSHPSQSHNTPGLCLASCLARSFLLEKPPPVDCGQSP